MVRKLVVLEIMDDPDSLLYAIYWTDFSAKRKDPLKVDTAFATTGARAHALAKHFIGEGIAKGWNKVGWGSSIVSRSKCRKTM